MTAVEMPGAPVMTVLDAWIIIAALAVAAGAGVALAVFRRGQR